MKKILSFFTFLTFAITIAWAAPKEQEKLYIFAAASTTDAVNELIAKYKESSKTEFATSYASSGALAKQIIDGGADANIFISADTKWMDELKKNNKAENKTEFMFGKNSLVLVASSKAAVKISKPEDLVQALGDSKLAIGDIKHVPAGQYAKDSLTYYKIYDTLESQKKLAQYADVRQTLNAVEMAQTDYGIVYKTDAAKSQKVKVVYTFPSESHKPIDYPACAVAGKYTPETKAFLKFMQSNKGKEIIKKYGF